MRRTGRRFAGCRGHTARQGWGGGVKTVTWVDDSNPEKLRMAAFLRAAASPVSGRRAPIRLPSSGVDADQP